MFSAPVSEPLLSILVPSTFERVEELSNLRAALLPQVADQPVEVLVFTDNRRRKLGKKREALVHWAKGQFICHIDDDDSVSQDFVAEVLTSIQANPGADLISYDSEAVIDDSNPFRVRTSLNFENEACAVVDGKWQDIRRKPWQWCTWRTSLAIGLDYQDGNVDEDWHWLKQMIPKVKDEIHLDKVLHYYRFNSKKSLCQK